MTWPCRPLAFLALASSLATPVVRPGSSNPWQRVASTPQPLPHPPLQSSGPCQLWQVCVDWERFIWPLLFNWMPLNMVIRISWSCLRFEKLTWIFSDTTSLEEHTPKNLSWRFDFNAAIEPNGFLRGNHCPQPSALSFSLLSYSPCVKLKVY